MRLIDDWERVLFGSWASRLGLASSVLGGVGAALFVFSDDLGDLPFFSLEIFCVVGAWVCATLVPAARVVKQKKISGGSDADR